MAANPNSNAVVLGYGVAFRDFPPPESVHVSTLRF
jgi:hypothetical protein